MKFSSSISKNSASSLSRSVSCECTKLSAASRGSSSVLIASSCSRISRTSVVFSRTHALQIGIGRDLLAASSMRVVELVEPARGLELDLLLVDVLGEQEAALARGDGLCRRRSSCGRTTSAKPADRCRCSAGTASRRRAERRDPVLEELQVIVADPRRSSSQNSSATRAWRWPRHPPDSAGVSSDLPWRCRARAAAPRRSVARAPSAPRYLRLELGRRLVLFARVHGLAQLARAVRSTVLPEETIARRRPSARPPLRSAPQAACCEPSRNRRRGSMSPPPPKPPITVELVLGLGLSTPGCGRPTADDAAAHGAIDAVDAARCRPRSSNAPKPMMPPTIMVFSWLANRLRRAISSTTLQRVEQRAHQWPPAAVRVPTGACETRCTPWPSAISATLPVGHAHHRAGVRHHARVVGREDEGGLLGSVQLPHQIEDVVAGDRVEVGGRLVGQHQLAAA